jgi:hypothetical protein
MNLGNLKFQKYCKDIGHPVNGVSLLGSDLVDSDWYNKRLEELWEDFNQISEEYPSTISPVTVIEKKNGEPVRTFMKVLLPSSDLRQWMCEQTTDCKYSQLVQLWLQPPYDKEREHVVLHLNPRNCEEVVPEWVVPDSSVLPDEVIIDVVSGKKEVVVLKSGDVVDVFTALRNLRKNS